MISNESEVKCGVEKSAVDDGRDYLAVLTLLGMVVFTLLACDQTGVVAIEMETYYHVFDKALAETRFAVTGERLFRRRAFVRVESNLLAGWNFGDSIRVGFRADGRQFVPDKVSTLSSPTNDGVQHSLVGWITGLGDEKSAGLVAFEFRVSEPEWTATDQAMGERKFVLVHFTQGTEDLRYHHLEVSRTVKGKAMMRK